MQDQKTHFDAAHVHSVAFSRFSIVRRAGTATFAATKAFELLQRLFTQRTGTQHAR